MKVEMTVGEKVEQLVVLWAVELVDLMVDGMVDLKDVLQDYLMVAVKDSLTEPKSAL